MKVSTDPPCTEYVFTEIIHGVDVWFQDRDDVECQMHQVLISL